MLGCCNTLFKAKFTYVIFSSDMYYRRIQYGVCPKCNCPKFEDYRIYFDGKDKVRYLTGNAATSKYLEWKKHIETKKSGSFNNQFWCYGDYRKTNKLDSEGNPIFLQLRNNFNSQSEVIGEVRTKTYQGRS